MQKIWIGILLVGVLALAAATPSFVVNGKSLKLETVEKNGKVYAEVVSLTKALGAAVTFDKAKNQFVIVTPTNAAPTVAGTTQLTGDAAELGKSYTLGKNYPLNFLLRSVEYSITRVTVGTEVYAPNADQKLLILHFTVQNPLKQAGLSPESNTYKRTHSTVTKSPNSRKLQLVMQIIMPQPFFSLIHTDTKLSSINS